MKIARYNPSDMSLISEDVTGLSFGDVVLGNYCNNVVAIKPVLESENLTSLGLYLEDRAGLDHTRFGLYKAATTQVGILPGDSRLNTSLMEAPGVSDYSQFSDYRVSYNVSDPEYTWLDANVGLSENIFGISNLNFRFVFEYN